jgi:polyadenylate-binding protein
VSCKLETYNDGKSKGYAYIQYKTKEEADAAKAALNGHEFRGKKIDIEIHEKREKREQLTTKFNNLFVKNFPAGTDDQQLTKMFEQFGEIESVRVQRGEGEELKDYGYVCFKDPEDAERALEGMNKKKVGDDFLIVNKHINKKDSEPTYGNKLNPITQNLTKTFNSNIYIKFIPSDVTED